MSWERRLMSVRGKGSDVCMSWERRLMYVRGKEADVCQGKGG